MWNKIICFANNQHNGDKAYAAVNAINTYPKASAPDDKRRWFPVKVFSVSDPALNGPNFKFGEELQNSPICLPQHL